MKYPVRVKLAAILCGLLLIALPFLDGGRTAAGLTCFLVVAGLVGVLIGPFQVRCATFFGAILVLLMLVWLGLLWSPYRYEALRMALYATAVAVLGLTLPTISGDRWGRSCLLFSLALGVLCSLWPILRQVRGVDALPEHWVDREFLGVVAFRVTGPMTNPNTFAAYLAFALPLIAGMALGSTRKLWWIWALLAAAVSGGLVLTFSRAGWLAAAVGMAFIVTVSARQYPHRLIRLLPVLVIIVICITLQSQAVIARSTALPTAEQGTLRHRLFMWQAGLDMWKASPLVGRGPGSYEVLYSYHRPKWPLQSFMLLSEPGSAHSDYVQFLAETGAVGCLLLGITFLAPFRKAMKQALRGRSHLAAGAVAVLLAALAGGLAQTNSRTPLCALVVLVAISITMSGAATVGSAMCRSALTARLLWTPLCVMLIPVSLMVLRSDLWVREAISVAYADRFEEASALLSKAEVCSFGDARIPGLRADMASSTELRGGGPALLLDAEQEYRKAARLDPFAAAVPAKLADVLERQGRQAEALNDYRQATLLDWYRGTHHFESGRLASTLGHHQLAKHHLSIATAQLPVWIELTRRRQGPDAAYVRVLEVALHEARTMLRALP